MPAFGTRSRNNLRESDDRLQRVFNEVVKHYDCSVICGYRGEVDQNCAYDSNRSTLKYPDSKHNQKPSMAVDVTPYPIEWEDFEGFYHFAGFVKGVATSLGVEIRWGGDWDSDYDLHDQIFNDFPHFEIAGD